MNRKIFRIAVIVITTVLSVTFLYSSNNFKEENLGPNIVQAGLQEDLEEVQERLAELKKQKQDLNSKINSENELQGDYSGEIGRLQAEVQLLDIEISEKKLRIDELALTIELLEKKIEETESFIIDSKISILDLEKETDEGLTNMYIEQKVLPGSISLIFTSSSTTNFIKNAQYKQSIQEDIN
ncbi:MAG TPA: hypothetical protein ENI23_15000, partial [bacterium]|nr:hypothetical protein [bacterium]